MLVGFRAFENIGPRKGFKVQPRATDSPRVFGNLHCQVKRVLRYKQACVPNKDAHTPTFRAARGVCLECYNTARSVARRASHSCNDKALLACQELIPDSATSMAPSLCEKLTDDPIGNTTRSSGNDVDNRCTKLGSERGSLPIFASPHTGPGTSRDTLLGPLLGFHWDLPGPWRQQQRTRRLERTGWSVTFGDSCSKRVLNVKSNLF